MSENRGEECDRRSVLKAGAALGAGVVAAGQAGAAEEYKPDSSPGVPAPEPADPVRVGFVGVGSRAEIHVNILLALKGAELRAVCDINSNRVKWARKRAREEGESEPEGYTGGVQEYKKMCARDDLDLVYTATPWRWHVPVCVAAMKAGKHAVTEVPAAITLEGCWKLVETSEKTGKHCIMLENCSYGRVELMALNMVRQGLLGEPLHAAGGYLHDLRANLFSESPQIYRLRHTIKRNGSLYCTHGLGPVANCLDINRGDRFERLVSMSTKSVCMNQYAAEKFGPDSPQAQREYACGDVNTTLIHTAEGRTITVGFSTHTPRPYSRMFMVQGSEGILRQYPERKIHVEGKSPGHSWEKLGKYRKDYEHPL